MRDFRLAVLVRLINNVLVLSLRATTEAIAKKILDACFSTSYDKDEWNLLEIK
ncbi:hypothetical protein [Nostoc sp. ChiQUE01b]|uniref:hypothetical protein n=1 Tax=Nostoc sp. ChiQUE01b TaxID=3075376 RepID=UPI002AD3666B|nr:hypothetical protein [Nostoc sp. ChiQUE01b]MDZ8260819.1 hypothetical protein [Nostoc sp. ChiQUE01b]